MSIVPRLAADFETHIIGPGAVFPRPVCLTAARRPSPGADPVVDIVTNGDPHWESAIEWVLDFEGETFWHNGPGFDLPVIAIHFPRMISKVFRLVETGRARDTLVREKLLNLASHGFIDYFFIVDDKGNATKKDVTYGQERLVAKYLGIDVSAEKGEKGKRGGPDRKAGGEFEGTKKQKQDIWRFHFDKLDGVPASQYPPEALDYVLRDAKYPLLVSEAQDSIARDRFDGHTFLDKTPFDVYRTETLHAGAKFALSLATYPGFGVDAPVVADLEAAVQRALVPERTNLLYSSGLLIAPRPAEPMTRLNRKTGERLPVLTKAGAPKMKKAQKGKKSNKLLLKLVLETHAAHALCKEATCPKVGKPCDEHGLGTKLKRTPPSKKFPKTPENPEGGQTSCDGEVISDLAPWNPILAQFDEWQGLRKVVDVEIPKLKEALALGGTIHPTFDDLKKTGRVSSRKSKSFPSINIQQIGRGFNVEYKGPDGKVVRKEKIEPRHAYISPYPGWLLLSIDYSYVELCTLAQTLYRIFGHSRLRDVINAGHDPHAFLGAQLAVGLDKDFSDYVASCGTSSSDLDGVYQLFRVLKFGTKPQNAFFKLYRNFAKPTGLGYPGGLGAKTLIGYAKNTYGVIIESVEQAKSFKEVWIRAFPEMGEYLGSKGYVSRNLVDAKHSKSDDDRFCYFSPLGMHRANCFFCEAANGFALQGPAAEGMKIAIFNIARACWDPEEKSCLYGCRHLAAVHDEVILTVPDDQWMHERAFEASRIWIAGMRKICPDVNIYAEPAAMRRWDKNAEPVYGDDDRLRVWEPGVNYVADAKEKLRVPKPKALVTS